jgi:hypothetical protein
LEILLTEELDAKNILSLKLPKKSIPSARAASLITLKD